MGVRDLRRYLGGADGVPPSTGQRARGGHMNVSISPGLYGCYLYHLMFGVIATI